MRMSDSTSEDLKSVRQDELPESWQVLPLSDCLETIRNGITATQNREGFGLPVTRIETISQDRINRDKVGYISSVSAEQLIRYTLRTGDILFSHINSEPQLGRTAICTGGGDPLLHGMNLLMLRANGRVDPWFLHYQCQSLRSRGVFVRLAARAVGQSSINQGKLKALGITVPPLCEQRAIAAVLRTVQQAKEATERVIAATRQLKASLLHHLFTYGPVSFDQADRVPLKETEYGSVPEAWNVIELKDAVAEIDYGLSAPIPKTPPKGGTNIVSTADITKDGRLLYAQIRQVEVPAKSIARLTLKGGDLLFNWRNSPELVGKTAVFEGQLVPHIFASFILRVRTREERTHNLFLKQLLNHYRTSRVFLSLARRAVNQANYNRNEISLLAIPHPPVPEQREIAAQLLAVDAKIAAEESRRAALDALFKSLLHNLMTGKVRLPGFAGGAK
jgi:type I restriction enzyme, S subunit